MKTTEAQRAEWRNEIRRRDTYANTDEKRLLALLDDLDAALALLRKHEWGGEFKCESAPEGIVYDATCLCCHRMSSKGHAEGCEWAALLAEPKKGEET